MFKAIKAAAAEVKSSVDNLFNAELEVTALEAARGSSKQGWLKKLGHNFKSWKNRWFILKGTRVYYFETQSALRALGCFYLTGYKIEMLNEKRLLKQVGKEGKLVMFILSQPNKRSYTLCADTQESMEEWIRCITVELTQAPVTTIYATPPVNYNNSNNNNKQLTSSREAPKMSGPVGTAYSQPNQLVQYGTPHVAAPVLASMHNPYSPPPATTPTGYPASGTQSMLPALPPKSNIQQQPYYGSNNYGYATTTERDRSASSPAPVGPPLPNRPPQGTFSGYSQENNSARDYNSYQPAYQQIPPPLPPHSIAPSQALPPLPPHTSSPLHPKPALPLPTTPYSQNQIPPQLPPHSYPQPPPPSQQSPPAPTPTEQPTNATVGLPASAKDAGETVARLHEVAAEETNQNNDSRLRELSVALLALGKEEETKPAPPPRRAGAPAPVTAKTKTKAPAAGPLPPPVVQEKEVVKPTLPKLPPKTERQNSQPTLSMPPQVSQPTPQPPLQPQPQPHIPAQQQTYQPPAAEVIQAPGSCAKCSLPLSGECIQAVGLEFHRACFGCYTCGKQLTGKCLNVGGKPYCEGCGKQAFTGAPKKMAETTGMMGLMQWCKNRTAGYKDVEITNWTKSWQDGLAFCALLHSYRPDLIPFNQLKKENKEQNLRLAFDVATNKLRIEQLLDPEDFGLEKLSMMTYMSQVYKTLEQKR
eukprot:TRINITY_DN3203_c0_g1_i1.p1 TRINITY_DN3203_c0_g1~~TRINITY_DN3203_c0_g1_i1.p1  ORF type:complete len:700 (-),score=197.52 TRINITY_DN3203_c0_g1_i1:1477-3576(-)